MKKQMSVSAQFFWGKIVLGVIWIGAAISGMFDAKLAALFNIVFLFAAIIIIAVLLFINKEENDEMSIANINKAKAITLEIIHILCAILSVVFIIMSQYLTEMNMDWLRIMANMIYALMGVQNLLVGIVFRKLEAE